MSPHPSRAHGPGTPVAIALLVATLLAGFAPGETGASSSPCFGSTDQFGTRFFAGTCAITADTTWGNGTFVLRGNLTVRPRVQLAMWNLTLRLDPAVEQEWRIYVNGGRFVVRGGAIASNTTHHWRLETSEGVGTLVDLDGVHVSSGGAAGGGPYSAFALSGGNGHRFRHLTVTDSALNADWDHAVISTWNAGITDLRIENSTFARTGRVLQMVAWFTTPTDFAFHDNVIEDFNGSGAANAIYGYKIDLVNNRIATGTNQAVWLARGGGPAWKLGDPRHRVAGNTITAGMALFLSDASGYDITGNTFHGRVDVGGNGNDFAFNTISDLDATDAIVTFHQNGTVRHNAWRNVILHGQGALVERGGYGNVSLFANSLEVACAGTNCMAIEVINVQDEQGPTYPGFPTVTVSWNNVTWTTFAPGSDSVTLDNEFSRRLYIHNNTQRIALERYGSDQGVTTAILAGGLLDSVVENNTMVGPLVFGIYNFIYEDARNVFQYNTFVDARYAGIFQSGHSVIRHNRVEGAGNGWWICPHGPCAGTPTNPVNLTFYDNAVQFKPGGINVTRMTWPDFLNNTFIGHGPAWSNNSRKTEPVYGGWLFFANATIDRIAWANRTGARRVTITVLGQEYFDEDPGFGALGNAAVSVAGALDRRGSVGGATVLWALDPNGATRLTVTAKGGFRLAVSHFLPNERYNVLIWDRDLHRWSRADLVTDGGGAGSTWIPTGSVADLILATFPSGPGLEAFSGPPPRVAPA